MVPALVLPRTSLGLSVARSILRPAFITGSTKRAFGAVAGGDNAAWSHCSGSLNPNPPGDSTLNVGIKSRSLFSVFNSKIVAFLSSIIPLFILNDPFNIHPHYYPLSSKMIPHSIPPSQHPSFTSSILHNIHFINWFSFERNSLKNLPPPGHEWFSQGCLGSALCRGGRCWSRV